MTDTYRSEHAADPALFERLMRERYGPLSKVLAERTRPCPPSPPPRRRPAMPAIYTPKPDPDAARHFADLSEAVGAPSVRPIPADISKRTPPAPGMTWCYSCDGWCTDQGICGCNDA
ncbi:hypothetical protein [Streptomyces sp. H51]|uniref:hypothetical protein n=1 Tax=Streptomyces sp. H51 TaxID=3111770 RepID=UPI002D787309|nr:hypothetical protein [Streptomyces sp. H51]